MGVMVVVECTNHNTILFLLAETWLLHVINNDFIRNITFENIEVSVELKW